jgi:hypothetical protein
VEFITFRRLLFSSITIYTPVAPLYNPNNRTLEQRQVEWNYSLEKISR